MVNIKDRQDNRPIFMLLLFVVVLWGINVVMIKYLTTFFPPLALVPIRMTLATALLFAIVGRQYGLPRLPREIWGHIVTVAAFSIIVHQITLNYGVTMTSGTHAVLILGLNPLVTTVLASFLVKERLSLSKGLGIVLGFSGVMLVVYGRHQGTATMAGDMVMLLSTFAAAFGSIFIKKCTMRVEPLVVTAYSHLLASVVLLSIGFAVNPVWSYAGAFAPWPLFILLFSSFVNTAMGAYWWNTGIQKVGASTASLFQNGIPIAGVFASALFLAEELHWNHFAALLLVFAGVSLGAGVISFSLLRPNPSGRDR
jgi:drug/metabolite transporter (DMT)-like permease